MSAVPCAPGMFPVKVVLLMEDLVYFCTDHSKAKGSRGACCGVASEEQPPGSPRQCLQPQGRHTEGTGDPIMMSLQSNPKGCNSLLPSVNNGLCYGRQGVLRFPTVTAVGRHALEQLATHCQTTWGGVFGEGRPRLEGGYSVTCGSSP
eukprot:3250666-Rhodomonas_salina.3